MNEPINPKDVVMIVGKVTGETLPMIIQKFGIAERCLKNAGYENIINPAKNQAEAAEIKFNATIKYDILYVTDDWPDDKLSSELMICALAEKKKILWLSRLQRQLQLM
jgi:hypothetical protein